MNITDASQLHRSRQETDSHVHPRTCGVSRCLGTRRPLLHSIYTWLCTVLTSSPTRRRDTTERRAGECTTARHRYKRNNRQATGESKSLSGSCQIYLQRQERSLLGTQPDAVRHLWSTGWLGKDQQGTLVINTHTSWLTTSRAC